MSNLTGWYSPLIVATSDNLKVGQLVEHMREVDGNIKAQPQLVIRVATLDEFMASVAERAGPPPPGWRPHPRLRFYEVHTD